MYKEVPRVHTPSDGTTLVWRYMSFPKFVSLLSQQALFFASIPTLRKSDVYEGFLAEADAGSAAKDFERLNKLAVVSCWYMDNEESAAMWKLYHDAIAIRTTLASLIDSLQGFTAVTDQGNRTDVDFHVGQIEYLPAAGYSIPDAVAPSPVLHKRKSFEHERELRVFIELALSDRYLDTYTEFYGGPDENQFPDLVAEVKRTGGILHHVNRTRLIQEVLVSPNLDDWTVPVVKSLMSFYGLDAALVRKSPLNTLS